MPRAHFGLTCLTTVAASALALTGCSAQDAEADDDALVVLASFYPLAYLAGEVGGALVQVGSLTPPGAEPHDVELSPRQVREVGEADVVVVLSGFQPAVDEAVEARRPAHLVDAAATPAVAEHLAEGEEGTDEDDDGHGHEGGDPHFWLDPTLMAAVAQDVARALAEVDPDRAEDFQARATALAAQLTELDARFADGLADCDRRVIVTAHTAFGFLAERYDLEQVGVSGLDPEAEPSPARIREIREVAAEHEVTTVFTEELVNPRVAETLAADLGIATDVLDPVESQVDDATDYRGAMEQNLVALRAALGCR